MIKPRPIVWGEGIEDETPRPVTRGEGLRERGLYYSCRKITYLPPAEKSCNSASFPHTHARIKAGSGLPPVRSCDRRCTAYRGIDLNKVG